MYNSEPSEGAKLLLLDPKKIRLVDESLQIRIVGRLDLLDLVRQVLLLEGDIERTTKTRLPGVLRTRRQPLDCGADVDCCLGK